MVRWFFKLCALTLLSCVLFSCAGEQAPQTAIPLAEHPRPDFQRDLWMNLNGEWAFAFDPDDTGSEQRWYDQDGVFTHTILVPFPWGSPLSGVENEADIGWYERTIEVPSDWEEQRVFVVVGASDWRTTMWLDGHELGTYQGGYTPFAFELTPYVEWGAGQSLVVRVDDTPHDFKLEGKQGYGAARGIWQTIYLEARPEVALATVHLTPDIDTKTVRVRAVLDAPAPRPMRFTLEFAPADLSPSPVFDVAQGAQEITGEVSLPSMRLWSLDDPYLYEVTAVLSGDGSPEDRVGTYFGMRKIGVVNLPGTDYPYISLNGKPIYLQLSLDQAYHPEGYYTFPSDEFMRNEILRSKNIGLNGQRIHVKIGIPRKLYWADKLGLLIMADVPNSWGGPDEDMRRETEVALRGMIERDYNHPAIFSWVNFNETWGLTSEGNEYLPETQEWVASIYRLTKELDPTRLVEDNSPNKHDHVETDINSWHSYLPGYAWREQLARIVGDTYPGSTWNFAGGRTQGSQPLLNSECGNVWGYTGSTGDVDWSWDYHTMINEFRRQPKICGWLYTEHHDVINEWNGYWRYDRTEKFTGMDEMADGMTMNDLHSEIYVSLDHELCRQVSFGERVEVPLYASFLTDADYGGELTLLVTMTGWDEIGVEHTIGSFDRPIPYEPWMTGELDPLELTMPGREMVVICKVAVKSTAGDVLHRNFTTFLVTDDAGGDMKTTDDGDTILTLVRTSPGNFSDATWTLKQWNVFDGLKANGAGSGYFEYELPWPDGVSASDVGEASFVAELSAKRLLGKDRDDAGTQEGSFMRGRGTHDPGLNPNAYPMSDEYPDPSAVRVLVEGREVASQGLADDPADHRGILSWFGQKRDNTLTEAGSYGYLLTAPIPSDLLSAAERKGSITVRLEVDETLPGGLAVYGRRFGRYPVDPAVVFRQSK